MSELDKAIVALQADLPVVEKRQTAEVETKTGGTFRYSYADLADIAPQVYPLLSKHGLAFTAAPRLTDDGKLILRCKLRHTSGEADEAEWPLVGATPQMLGAAMTYGRRYCLCAMTGLVTEDDDDAAAAEAQAQGRRGTAQRATQPRSNRSPAANAGATAQRARPAGQPPLPTDGGGITPDQQRKLHAALRDANLAEREAGLAYISSVLKREVTSTKDLSKRDAAAVIDALEPDPDGEA